MDTGISVGGGLRETHLNLGLVGGHDDGHGGDRERQHARHAHRAHVRRGVQVLRAHAVLRRRGRVRALMRLRLN